MFYILITSLAALGALAHLLQHWQNPKWTMGYPKLPTGPRKVSIPRVLVAPILDPCSPPMRKADAEGETGKKRWEKRRKRMILSETVVTNVVTTRSLKRQPT